MMTEKDRPVIIIGGGGHAKVVADVLQLQGFSVLGYTDIDDTHKALIPTINQLGNDTEIYHYHPADILLANGLGSVKTTTARRKIYNDFTKQGYRFVKCVHPSTVIATDVKIDEGTQIMAGTIIQPGCVVGRNTIINTKASVDHDCIIGDHVHVAPGVTISGGVCIGENTHIGTGATIIQGVSIGTNCLIGAGAVVIANVKDGMAVVGVPAREVSR